MAGRRLIVLLAALACLFAAEPIEARFAPSPSPQTTLLEYSGGLVAAGGQLAVTAGGTATFVTDLEQREVAATLDPRTLRALRVALSHCRCRNRTTRSPDWTEHRLRFQIGTRTYGWRLWPVDARHPDARAEPMPTRGQRRLLRLLDAIVRRVAARRIDFVYRRHEAVAPLLLTVTHDRRFTLLQGYGVIGGRFPDDALRRIRALLNRAGLRREAIQRRRGPGFLRRDFNAYPRGATLEVVPSDRVTVPPLAGPDAALVSGLDSVIRRLLRDHTVRVNEEALDTRLRPVRALELAPAGAWQIVGAHPGDRAGSSVAAAGDVNGDGIADYVIGAPFADTAAGLHVGRAYVVFGTRSPARVDLAKLGRRGFRIEGTRAEERLGSSVAGVGDVNRDGRDDVLVGAPYSSPRGRVEAGSAFVVYGKADSRPVRTRHLGTRGLRLDGAYPGERAGASVSPGGDTNGDGIADLVVGAGRGGRDRHLSSATAYVVLGSPSAPPIVDLRTPGTAGFRIAYEDPGRLPGTFLAAKPTTAGDVNGDGLDDLALGGQLVWYRRELDNGRIVDSYTTSFEGERAYVIFGRRSPGPLNPARLGEAGYELRLETANEQYLFGSAVAAAGDVNADGRGDIAVGASGYHAAGAQRGSVFIVFGTAETAGIDPLAPGAAQRIDGPRDYGYAGSALAGAGDVDRDGKPDLLVGAQGSDGACADGPGRAYVWLAGGESPRARGYELSGLPLYSGLGSAVAARPASRSDRGALVLGAPGMSPSAAREVSGMAYVMDVARLTRRAAQALPLRTFQCGF